MNNSNKVKKANSKGSIYDGYKLSSIALDESVEHDRNLFQLGVGFEDDDINENEGRLKVFVDVSINETEYESTEFDLEDFLIEVKKICPQLFKQ